jgi:3-phenylpropionate/cinnamic acid dioxygenase small subunit
MALTMEDRAEIHDVYARYAYTFDGADAAGWAALFTEDGRFEPPGVDPVVGREALHDFVASRSGDLPGMRHMIANVLVEADGDVVRGRAYFLCFRLGGDDQFRIRNFGRYEDEFAREDGRWRISVRGVVGELPLPLVDAPFAFA